MHFPERCIEIVKACCPKTDMHLSVVKEEEVDLSEYIDYNDAYRQLGRFLEGVYTHKRIHIFVGLPHTG